MNNKTVYILIGPSGSGKTTLGLYLKSIGIPELVSHTTRGPRTSEVHGVSYYFINEKEMDLLDKVEESAYDGLHKYALSRSELETKLENFDKVFTIMDRDGVDQMRNRLPFGMVKIIYIDVSTKHMVERMTARGDSFEKIMGRVNHAHKSGEFKNSEIADFIIHNDVLEQSIAQLQKIVAA